jgi:hypothetical protein
MENLHASLQMRLDPPLLQFQSINPYLDFKAFACSSSSFSISFSAALISSLLT